MGKMEGLDSFQQGRLVLCISVSCARIRHGHNAEPFQIFIAIFNAIDLEVEVSNPWTLLLNPTHS